MHKRARDIVTAVVSDVFVNLGLLETQSANLFGQCFQTLSVREHRVGHLSAGRVCPDLNHRGVMRVPLSLVTGVVKRHDVVVDAVDDVLQIIELGFDNRMPSLSAHFQFADS